MTHYTLSRPQFSSSNSLRITCYRHATTRSPCKPSIKRTSQGRPRCTAPYLRREMRSALNPPTCTRFRPSNLAASTSCFNFAVIASHSCEWTLKRRGGGQLGLKAVLRLAHNYGRNTMNPVVRVLDVFQSNKSDWGGSLLLRAHTRVGRGRRRNQGSEVTGRASDGKVCKESKQSTVKSA